MANEQNLRSLERANVITSEEAAQVGGGEGECTSTASVNTGIVNVTTTAPDPASAMIAIYEGAVAFTSHVIERVANGTSE